MTLTANLIVALGFLFAIFAISQLIYLAKRMYDSMLLNRHRRRESDRQGTVYSVQEERPNNRYGDIFFIEPGSEEANRIREQLEKDEKDLPSYDEVMRMCNLTTPTAAAAAPATAGTPQTPTAIDGCSIGIAALPAPPYSETDPHAGPTSIASAISTPATNPPHHAISIEPSTSRAAQTPTSMAPVTMTLSSTVSNTQV